MNKVKQEKVSIIVPIYNVEKYLQKCIESLISQTYSNIDILLVDDGSPDNCGKICDEYAKKDKRIIVVHKENGGYGSVLEYSINHIKTKYFLICDPDDWLEPDAVEKLYNAMINNKTDLVIGGKNLVYSDGTTIDELKTDRDTLFKNVVPNIKSKKLIDFISLPPSPHSKLYKTEFAKKIDFPSKISYTDLLLYYVYLSRIESAIFIDETLSNYYFDRPGNTVEEGKTLKASSFKAISIQRDSIIKQLNQNEVSNYILGHLINLTANAVSLIKRNSTEEILTYKKELIKIIYKLKPYKKYTKKINRMISKSKLKAHVKNILISLICNKFTTNFGLFLMRNLKTGK